MPLSSLEGHSHQSLQLPSLPPAESSIVFVAADKLPVLAKALTKVNGRCSFCGWARPKKMGGRAAPAVQGWLGLS